MKTLGLIGGTTWHSTIEYYRAINEGVHARLGGSNSARLILYSVNFEELKPPTDPAGWARVAAELTSIAQRVEAAGVPRALRETRRTWSRTTWSEPSAYLSLTSPSPWALPSSRRAGLRTVGLLGTRPTMEQGFIKDRLAARGITTVVPDEASRAFLHSSILEELGQGIFTASTKARYLAIIDELAERGARGVILGCTEIPLLIKPGDCRFPVFDTTALHAAAAIDFALGG